MIRKLSITLFGVAALLTGLVWGIRGMSEPAIRIYERGEKPSLRIHEYRALRVMHMPGANTYVSLRMGLENTLQLRIGRSATSLAWNCRVAKHWSVPTIKKEAAGFRFIVASPPPILRCGLSWMNQKNTDGIFGQDTTTTQVQDTVATQEAMDRFLSTQTLQIVIGLPLWAAFILFATYPCVAFFRGPFRRWRRRKNGLCINCAYNLTGNVSGICPECARATEVM